MTIARHLVIHGRVQGVWYRGWAIDTARALGLAGWVRSRRDGTVEAVVQGDWEAVEQFVALAREGPRAASVERIDMSEAEPASLSGFEQRDTL